MNNFSSWQLRRREVTSSLWILLLVLGLHLCRASSSKAILVFQAQCQLLSEPICDDPQELREFLERPAIRDLFLSAGGHRPCHSIPIDSDVGMRDLWRQACKKYYGIDALPEMLRVEPSKNLSSRRNERIAVLATETVVQFPGFKTINSVLNGCQHIPSEHSTNESKNFFSRMNLSDKAFPKENELVHKFYLIGDKKRWVGPAPIVWLVRKLTGIEGTKDGPYSSSETRAVSQVSVYVQNDHTVQMQQRTVGFQLDIDCAVKVEFPKFLLRLLPAPRHKVEQRGTQAIRTAILQDANSAVQAVAEAWAMEH